MIEKLKYLFGNSSGHTAVNIGKSKVVVFGGLVDKKFLNDIFVYDAGINAHFLLIFHAHFLLIFRSCY